MVIILQLQLLSEIAVALPTLVGAWLEQSQYGTSLSACITHDYGNLMTPYV